MGFVLIYVIFHLECGLQVGALGTLEGLHYECEYLSSGRNSQMQNLGVPYFQICEESQSWGTWLA